MNIIEPEIKDFIGIYTNVYPKGYCQHVISEFERLQHTGVALTRKETDNSHKHEKDDFQIFMNLQNVADNIELFNSNPWVPGNPVPEMFFKGLQHCFEHYADKFSILRSSGRLRGTVMKAQKTVSGGGYHIWHAEHGGDDKAPRALVYMLYLNTIPAEAYGETEFLYQERRIAPVENTIVIWPAGYTHAHRGNPVYGDVAKYIITGWFYYD